MKVEFSEHEGCFGIELEPETMTEAAQLVRFGINATKQVRTASAYAHSDKTISASIVIGKRRNPNNEV